MRADCVTLWIGDSLGRVERACLRSIARHHRVAVYCYGETRGVPDEVEVRDANQVIPANEIFFQRNGSVAAFSDRFRHELLRANAGTWVNTDIYLLRPLDMEASYLFGQQEPGLINNAVLRIPAEFRCFPPCSRCSRSERPPNGCPGDPISSRALANLSAAVSILLACRGASRGRWR